MDSRLKRQRLLAQVLLLTAFPNFLTQASKYRSCAHAQGLIRQKGASRHYNVFSLPDPVGCADADRFPLF
jgi:hypothetical protein